MWRYHLQCSPQRIRLLSGRKVKLENVGFDERQQNNKHWVMSNFFLISSIHTLHFAEQDAHGKELRKTTKYATQALRSRQVLEEINDFNNLDPESEDDSDHDSADDIDDDHSTVSHLEFFNSVCY